MGPIEDHVERIMRQAFEASTTALERTHNPPGRNVTDHEALLATMELVIGIREAVMYLAEQLDQANGP